VFENLKARLEQLLQAGSGPDARGRGALLREALLEAKVGVSTMRAGLVSVEQELLQERRRLSDAERRGRLAAELPDAETVALAERYARRHRERILVLERKLSVQRDELLMAEREVAEMLQEYRAARPGQASASIEAAWRDIEAAGGDRPLEPGSDTTGSSPVQESLEREEKLKRAVEEQLAYLKRKLGRDK
jgi:hypothetical protein